MTKLRFYDGFPPQEAVTVGDIIYPRCNEGQCCIAHGNGPGFPCCKCGQQWRPA